MTPSRIFPLFLATSALSTWPAAVAFAPLSPRYLHPATTPGAFELRSVVLRSNAGDDEAPSDSGEPDDIREPVVNVDVDSLKKELFRIAAGLNRGINARENERARVLELVSGLEASVGPLFSPCAAGQDGQAPVADGEWRLLFTTALDVLIVGTTPFAEVGQVYQNIYLSEGEPSVVNVIELQPKLAAVLNPLVGSSMTRLRVTAGASVENAQRIRIAFARVEVEPVSLLGNQLSWLPDPLKQVGVDFTTSLRGDGGDPTRSAGYFDTTFCDEDLRISRSNNNDVFVLVRD